jgi:Zn-dependent peptidase ImmA (M78 family)/plasmid maintenance system antidote protein VapI
MERIQSINPERILWCCADYGITLDELALELDIAPGRIERVITGENGITFNQLRKVADFFGRGVLFFLEEGPVDAAEVHTAQFRTLTNQKPEVTPELKKFIERVEKQREVYLGLLEDMDETERVRFSAPDLRENPIPEAARVVRTWLGLGNRNDFNSYRTAVEAKGILVFRSNGFSGKWQIPKESPIIGFTLYDPDCPVIVVRKQASEHRQTFTLMHELGHLLLHKSSSIDDNFDLDSSHGRERDANSFAGHLLVPDNFLALINDSERPEEVSQFDLWLDRHCTAWGVSCEVILRRLLDAGRLPQSAYAAYRLWHHATLIVTQQGKGSRLYRHREPMHVFGDTYVRTVLDALNARHITLTKASSYLDSIKIKDLHSLEHFYAAH